MKVSTVVAAAFLVSAGMSLPVHAQDKAKAAQKGGGGDMTFFVTSAGSGRRGAAPIFSSPGTILRQVACSGR